MLSGKTSEVSHIDATLTGESNLSGSISGKASLKGEVVSYRGGGGGVNDVLVDDSSVVRNAIAYIDLTPYATESELDNYATKSELGSYATKSELSNYAEKSDLDAYATKAELNDYATKSELNSYATKSELDDYATKAELNNYAEKADLDDYATKAELSDYAKEEELSDYATKAELSDYATKSELSDYATKESLDDYATKADLDDYATKTDLDDYATKADLDDYATKTDLDNYATKAEIPTNVSELNNDSGYIDGLFLAAYGKSTFADVLDAYKGNKIVYARASSQSNPASGSQTRMAFMAYVNNETNPTEFEFQYYRSVNQHTATQQGDQVYVYKLNKSTGWSVIVREAYTKIAVGTGLTSSYSNGTLTISLA